MADPELAEQGPSKDKQTLKELTTIKRDECDRMRIENHASMSRIKGHQTIRSTEPRHVHKEALDGQTSARDAGPASVLPGE